MPKYSEVKSLLKDDDFLTEIYIPFNYIVSAIKDNNFYGLQRAEYSRLKCSFSNQTSNPINDTVDSIEYFLNGLLEGKGANSKITIYLRPYKTKQLDKKFEDSKFVLNDFKCKIERYINILKKIDSEKYKNLNIDNLNMENVNIQYDGYEY
nr:hypothetical protein [[Eubacterium] tenue]